MWLINQINTIQIINCQKDFSIKTSLTQAGIPLLYEINNLIP